MKLVKIFSMFLVVAQLSSCKGQNEDGIQPKNKAMTTERFDLEKYNECIGKKKKEGEIDLSQCEYKLADGTTIISVKDSEESFSRVIPPAPALFETVKVYHGDGFLKEEYSRYMGVFLTSSEVRNGVTKFYDKQGNLTKTVDETTTYKEAKLKIEDLLKVLANEPLLNELTNDEKATFKSIFGFKEDVSKVTKEQVYEAFGKRKVLNPSDEKDRKSLGIIFVEKEKKWSVVKDLYPFGTLEIDVNSDDGSIIRKKYNKEARS